MKELKEIAALANRAAAQDDLKKIDRVLQAIASLVRSAQAQVRIEMKKRTK